MVLISMRVIQKAQIARLVAEILEARRQSAPRVGFDVQEAG
jgi:hypothetical protein